MVNSVIRRIWRKLYFNFCIHYKPVPVVLLGSEYGGWTIPAEKVDNQSVCYLVGAGLDISFDLELASQYKCQVHIFDPSPRALAHFNELKEHVDSARMMRFKEGIYSITKEDFELVNFHPFGLWVRDEVVKFFMARNPEHAICSVINLHQTAECFDGEVVTIKTAMSRLGHSRIDLLKLNIAGAEYDVLTDLINNNIEISLLCVRYEEFHHAKDLGFIGRINRSIKQLKVAGYRVIAVDSYYNITFIKL